ncbi:MAG: energy-coupling factor transporter ATPase [Clostridiales bacterium]|nr:energy-coupling factor transporter ATPase [Clostridiales bacterium]
MSEKEIVIKAEDLGFVYDDEESGAAVLHGVDVEIERGSFVAVLGHNGSGKSTFAKLCNLILEPTSGALYLFGKKIDGKTLSDDDLYDIRRRVGMVFQNPDNQLVATIVEEDVAFGPENLGIKPDEIRRRVDDALALVGMSEFKRHSPHQLSGGQKQRVAIAGIIALSPEIIIFDEATAMLDPIGRREVIETIKKLNREQNKTVILITHYMEEAIEADRVIVIDDGRIMLDGTPKEVFSKTSELRAAGLDVPQVAELAASLRADGYDIGNGILSADECADEIDKIIKRKRK